MLFRSPTDPIRHPTEQQSAQRPEGEREDERFGYRALGNTEICRNGGYTKDENEIVESIQRPAKKTCGEGVALSRCQCPEWSQEVHQAETPE